MKRRNFCRYTALSSACLAGAVMGTKSPKAKLHHKWVVLYWMPYDNDLVRFGESIIEMLLRATQNSEAAVVIQSDYSGDMKMRRRYLAHGITHESNVAGEDSSDVSAFSTYLDWANQTFEADHWAVIIVGHGGMINEINPDDHSSTRRTRTWMRVNQFANVLSRFNQTTERRVELLFFQNCNKATLEVIYEVRNCARYTLASQRALGAPNYYYEGFLKRLNEPLLDGRGAALAIMDSEHADMYHTLTLIDNQAVEDIPEQLSRVLQPILSGQLSTIRQAELSPYRYFGEQQCDVLILLTYLPRVSHRGQDAVAVFADFLHSSVITSYRTGGELYGGYFLRSRNLEALCGIGLYLPETEQAASRYGSLALYQAVDLLGLYGKILAG
jgi:Clostripain family